MPRSKSPTTWQPSLLAGNPSRNDKTFFSFRCTRGGHHRLLALSSAPAIQAQEGSDPAARFSAAIVAACRAMKHILKLSTADSAAAFRVLPAEQRTAFLKRFSLSDMPGKPLSSTDPQNHAVLLCQTPSGTVQYRLALCASMKTRLHSRLRSGR